MQSTMHPVDINELSADQISVDAAAVNNLFTTPDGALSLGDGRR